MILIFSDSSCYFCNMWFPIYLLKADVTFTWYTASAQPLEFQTCMGPKSEPAIFLSKLKIKFDFALIQIVVYWMMQNCAHDTVVRPRHVHNKKWRERYHSTSWVNSSPLGINGHHFADIFNGFLWNEKFCVLIQVSPQFVPKGLIDNKPTGNGLVPNRQQAITWTNVDPVYHHIYPALGGDGLNDLGYYRIDLGWYWMGSFIQ